jgi:hypothetical protein
MKLRCALVLVVAMTACSSGGGGSGTGGAGGQATGGSSGEHTGGAGKGGGAGGAAGAGAAGSSGSGGAAGGAGSTGAAGDASIAGSAGAAGGAGGAGVEGTAGAGGVAGSTGTAGTTGAAGSIGIAGSSGNGGAVDPLCAASPGAFVWGKTAIEAASTTVPVDVVMGQTDDVVAAAVVGGNTFAQYRWDASGGTKYNNHDGPGGQFTGPLFTSGLWINPVNDAVFYGLLQSGPMDPTRRPSSPGIPRGAIRRLSSRRRSLPRSPPRPARPSSVPSR